jgi:3-deoxy-D-arabino-heptulosonate 7-phosphate (DAHP) synthase
VTEKHESYQERLVGSGLYKIIKSYHCDDEDGVIEEDALSRSEQMTYYPNPKRCGEPMTIACLNYRAKTEKVIKEIHQEKGDKATQKKACTFE